MHLFDVNNELSSSLINYLFQDSNGLLWVATEEGLNCYDGNKFRQFRHSTNDSSSLCSNYVNSLFETKCGKLLICTNRGIQIYNPSHRNFEGRIKDFDNREFTASVVQAIDRGNGEYWVVGDSIRILNKPEENHIGLSLSKAPDVCADLKHIHCGVKDNDGNLWLSLSERGLLSISPDNQIQYFFGSIGQPSVSSMVIGKDGLLYLGTTSHGLLRYDGDGNEFEYLSPSTGKEIKNLFADTNGNILQATDGTGIVIYNPATGLSSNMKFGNSFLNSGNAKTHYILKDNYDNLWITIFQTGLIFIPHSYNAFNYIGSDSEEYNVIGNNCISSIYKDSEGILWVGSDNDGIYALNPDFTSRAHFYNDDISVPMCMFEDSKKNLWVGTYLSGVGTIDRNNGKMNRIQLPLQSDIPANMCFAITEDRDHNVWLGMMHSGLIRYNLDSGMTSVDFPWRGKVDSFIASLYYSARTNALYIGTYSGLQIVNNLSHNNADVHRVLENDIVHSIDEDNDGIIWLGTTNGLISFNNKNGEFKRYGVFDGLHSTTIYAVRCEGKNVWMSLNRGIARLDTKTGKIANFFVGDGLQGNEFYKNSVFKDGTGHIYFGGTGGITHFNPRDIGDPGREWTPRIVDLYTHGSTLSLDESIYNATNFRLGSDENSFSVEFGTLELGRPETVRFAYSIDGKPWEVLPSNTNTVNFYDLEPGKHKLSFRTIDGFTESPVKSVSLAVAYPWYSSPWSWIVYIIVVLLVIFGVIQSYYNRMRSRAQLIELKHSDQLNEARLRSYVNISHEIRTPMSLVISPLQKLLATDPDAGRQREYKLIMRNAKRVLRLIDELMDLRKIEKHQMKLTMRKTLLVPFIQDICDTFAQAVNDKHQILTFNYSDSGITADIDSANFDKILMNLFSNAVKYTPKGGEIKVDLYTKDKDVIIKITDNGIGISDKDKERIFERFYRAEGNSSGGSGIGLHLAHQLVELHGGNLSVSDNPDGPGVSFILAIPIKSEFATKEKEELAFENQDNRELSHSEHLQIMQIPKIEEDDSLKPSSRYNTVLIVEDDEEIRNYLAMELGRYYKIETCNNGKEALDFIFKNPPDLVLSDVMMPEMDGFTLTRTIKNNINLNHIPVVLLTALNQDEDNINAITAGADSYFTKPFNIEVVRGRISALIQRYKELKVKYSGSEERKDYIEDIDLESADEKLIRRVVTVINKNLSDPTLSVEKLASEVGLSRVHLHRKLKELTNQSPSDFLRNIRLRQAAHLLKEKRLSVSEVTYAIGFNSASTFSTAFKRLYGVTPSAYVETTENVSITD